LGEGPAQHLAPSTLSVLYTLVKSIFESAVEDQHLRSNPCSKRTSLPKVQRRTRTMLTVDQVQQLAAVIGPR
jgi:hypothetical protein